MSHSEPRGQQAPQQATSMTIAEMRALHHSALSAVEAKRTELRLVLASRYRELVGSSDEVLRMRERAEELHELVGGIGGLVDKVIESDAVVRGLKSSTDNEAAGDKSSSVVAEEEEKMQQSLVQLPRLIHRYLDANDVHSAAFAFVDLCKVIHGNGGGFPLAAVLAGDSTYTNKRSGGAASAVQTKMVYLHIQTLPSRIVSMARKELLHHSSSAYNTAACLSSLDLLSIQTKDGNRATKLLDLYYDSKASLLNELLQKLSLTANVGGDATVVTENAESVLSNIVRILQHDVILYPYMIFVLRKFPVSDNNSKKNYEVVDKIMSTLPIFDPDVLKSKASRFLAAHLPLIRTKVKTVLMVIAGTTASKLGQIRQSLYDKTDGLECMSALDGNGMCSWDDAVGGIVDVRVVSNGTAFTEENTNPVNGGQSRRFSLWGALFSNTFSSLVHSLLTASFHSVHAQVVSTLRMSLARAPPFESMLPHEAHRNALRMSTDLDFMLRKVSDDAHELLVHAEEREESERRLRQSLYVQTCEIMGRLLNELRRMLLVPEENPGRELIVGRLCYLLKFRLKTLPSLLDPKNSPAVLAAGLGAGKSTGMITRFELQSSFDLEDDNDDGLISFDEAMQAMESAFSGTHLHGAEMVRDTLLLVQNSSTGLGALGSGSVALAPASNKKSPPKNVTLSELALLSARGLRHDTLGPESALGTVQSSLDDIVYSCFREWARAALSPSLNVFTNTLHDCIEVASTVSELEWRRLNGLLEKNDDILLKEIKNFKNDGDQLKPKETVVGQVSPHVVSYLLSLSGVLNRSVCPADSLSPVPSFEYASTLGISLTDKQDIPNMMRTIRGSLICEALLSLSRSLNQEIVASSEGVEPTDQNIKLNRCSPSSLIQILMDVKFIHKCFFQRNQHKFGFDNDDSYINDSREIMENISAQLSKRVKLAIVDGTSIYDAISERHSRVFSSCDLLLSSLFGEGESDNETLVDTLPNGVGSTSLLAAASDSTFLINPLVSSRRFILLPVHQEKLTETQLRAKYGKKTQDARTTSAAASSGNAIGAGFGFLSSMLSTKTR